METGQVPVGCDAGEWEMTGFAASLPQAGDEYDRETFQRLLEYIRELEEAAYMRNAHVEIYGDADSGSRQPELVLRSPDGTRYAVVVANGVGSTSYKPPGKGSTSKTLTIAP